MGYKHMFDPRDYQIMVLVEHEGLKKSEAARMLGLSKTRVSQRYYRAKLTQKRLYVAEIEKKTGKSLTQLLQDLDKEFNDNHMTIAYLEKEFPTILAAFREGEPESGYFITESTPRPRKRNSRVATHPNPEKLRWELTEQEQAVLDAVDRRGLSIPEMGAEMEMDEKTAYYAYRTAKMTRFRQLLHLVSERYGVPFDQLHKQAGDVHERLANRVAQLEHWLEHGYEDK